ncbi:MAG: L-2-hydroxyglutarate oxidase [Armatimonadota bacterium]|nr:L-2-hydroxyglutarate oxidase [bacterium]MDW8321744.1 L-2-hydroxyglutarate oxidase [Armatimonadota bacterium]
MWSDVLVVGGGIVGLATAYQLTRSYPYLRVRVVEKEPRLAQHQSGRNSGVLHSGIYYKPGSLKALTCRQGKALMQAFCEREQIPFEICGKVIVATQERELPALQTLMERGRQNGVRCELVTSEHLHQLEPCAAGLQAIHVPESGIVDFRTVCERLAERVREAGGEVLTGAKVLAVRETSDAVEVSTSQGEFIARYFVNCAGLYSDEIARLSGVRPPARIIPFRGEYYLLCEQARRLCRNLIYPVPDPRFPFLGVHFTRTISGEVECGPNAVLAFAREGYRKADVCWRELWTTLTYPGFWRLARRYWRTGVQEMWRSLSKRAFVQCLQRLVPEVRAEHLRPAPAGVRAQAVAPDGQMLDDFVWVDTPRAVHVLNAPSPAATASLAIAERIVQRLAERF